jgi:hypothetical protein
MNTWLAPVVMDKDVIGNACYGHDARALSHKSRLPVSSASTEALLTHGKLRIRVDHPGRSIEPCLAKSSC